MTGVLHDIVEETNVTLEQLRQLGYPDRVVEAIGCLTWRKEQESYEQYIQRLKPNSLAASVKRADLEDHLTPPIDCGQNWLEKNHPSLYERYQKALQELGHWTVLGKDAFDIDAEMVPLGEFYSEYAAVHAAYRQLEKLEKLQPSSSSGGQRNGGIQDRIYVRAPDGKTWRIMPPSFNVHPT